MVKRRGGQNFFDRRKKFSILRQRQAAHQYRAWVDFLMRRLDGELGKEIHRAKFIVSQKSEQKANIFHTFPTPKSLAPSAPAPKLLYCPRARERELPRS